MTANYVETAYLADDYDYDYDYDCAYYGDETEKAELQNNPARPDSDEEIETPRITQITKMKLSM